MTTSVHRAWRVMWRDSSSGGSGFVVLSSTMQGLVLTSVFRLVLVRFTVVHCFFVLFLFRGGLGAGGWLVRAMLGVLVV